MSKPITREERKRWAELWGHSPRSRTMRLLAALDAADKMADEIPHLKYAMERAALHNCAANPEFFEEEARHCDNVLALYSALVEPPK